jgi:hypothetical protein
MAATADRAAYIQEVATALDRVFDELAALSELVVAVVCGSVTGPDWP